MTGHEEAALAEIERRRLRALVDVDLAVAEQLHADEFQLITPGGAAYSKSEYLDAVASGQVDYRSWEPDEIDVRLHGDAACLRYRASIVIALDGDEQPLARLWHTDYYERHDGQWRVVWSHATRTSD